MPRIIPPIQNDASPEITSEVEIIAFVAAEQVINGTTKSPPYKIHERITRAIPIFFSKDLFSAWGF